MSTGVNQRRQGTLCYWLTYMLLFVTGNLGLRGGNFITTGFSPIITKNSPYGSTVHHAKYGDMRQVYASLPASSLADFIKDDANPVRALIVMVGNPLLAMSGEYRMREVFLKLDLVVSLDIYRGATAELAD